MPHGGHLLLSLGCFEDAGTLRCVAAVLVAASFCDDMVQCSARQVAAVAPDTARPLPAQSSHLPSFVPRRDVRSEDRHAYCRAPLCCQPRLRVDLLCWAVYEAGPSVSHPPRIWWRESTRAFTTFRLIQVLLPIIASFVLSM